MRCRLRGIPLPRCVGFYFPAFVVGGRFTRPKPVNAGRFYIIGTLSVSAGIEDPYPLAKRFGVGFAEVAGHVHDLIHG